MGEFLSTRSCLPFTFGIVLGIQRLAHVLWCTVAYTFSYPHGDKNHQLLEFWASITLDVVGSLEPVIAN